MPQPFGQSTEAANAFVGSFSFDFHTARPIPFGDSQR